MQFSNVGRGTAPAIGCHDGLEVAGPDGSLASGLTQARAAAAKGLYWETLTPMLENLGRAADLNLLQVRPENAGVDWKPTHRFNFLDNPPLPWSAKAKIVWDVAASRGQRSEQSFFRRQAQVQMEFAFKALDCAELPVTLETTYDFLSSDSLLKEIMATLLAEVTAAAASVAAAFLLGLESDVCTASDFSAAIAARSTSSLRVARRGSCLT